MTYIFSDIPASLARVCATKPIHFIVSTVLLASIAYLAIFDQYAESSYASNNVESINFYHSPYSSEWQLIKSNTELEKYSNAQHYYITPLKFKGISENLPTYPGAIMDAENEGFLISNHELSDSEFLQSLQNSNGEIFRLKSSNNKIGKYFEYSKSLFEKLLSLVKGAEPFDIFLVTMAYIAMWFTFFQLFYQMRQIGSKFWLAFGSLLSSCFAFLFALAATTEILHIKVPLVSLSEGLPFLVATIGFKHKLAFTAPVIEALNSNSDKNIADIIADVVKSRTAVPLIRDQLIISLSFLICSFLIPNLVGLRNFCILSAIILAVDLLFTFTFYASILSLKAQIFQVHREIELRAALEEDGISANIAKDVAEGSIDITKSALRNNRSIIGFKVFMLFGFIGLHLFALGTSWLYDDSADFQSISLNNTPVITKAITDAIKTIPSNGALITLSHVKVYRQVTAFTEIEHYIVLIFSKLSTAIADPLISKFLFIIAGISVAINIYLLNVTNDHLTMNHSTSVSEVSSSNLALQPTLAKKSKRKSKKKVTEKKIEEVVPVDDNSDNVKDGQIIEDNTTDSSYEASEELRPLDELVEILKAGNLKDCNNAEVLELVIKGKLPLYALEKQLGDNYRAVIVRRQAIANFAKAPVLLSEKLPYKNYDYDRVFGACCENVIGYVPIPLGVAGPIIIDGKPFHIPVATTEGCLVASTMRGCKAINAGGGVETVLTADGMTRGPCVQFPNLTRAGKAKNWLDSEEGQRKMKTAFNSTSRFARLQHIKTAIAGDSLYIRFKTTTGDAMGMNMISKGVEHALKCMAEEFGFEDMRVISTSGNYCIDKKAAAINWIDGRGKSIVASADVPADVVEKVLKSDVEALVELNIAKNLVGSALAGAVGGFNAHAANLLTAIYIATGQDPAQNVESSNCMTLMKKLPNGDLRISVSMPSIEVGTIGGGTVLDPQGAMLELLGIRGPHPTEPGANARQLAKVVASAVLAAELSLCSALAAGHLVQSHMQLNRKAPAPAETDPKLIKTTSDADIERLKEGSKICIRS